VSGPTSWTATVIAASPTVRCPFVTNRTARKGPHRPVHLVAAHFPPKTPPPAPNLPQPKVKRRLMPRTPDASSALSQATVVAVVNPSAMVSSPKAMTGIGKVLRTSAYASDSMVTLVVPLGTPAPTPTSAPSAALQSILLNPIRRRSLFPIVTPLIPDAWHELLAVSGALDRFPDVPEGLRSGFRLGTSSFISETFSPDNHKSALDNPSIIDDYVRKEEAAGRYSRAYTPDEFLSIFGPYRSAPLGVVWDTPIKSRLIQDHSFPRNNPCIASINSEIDSSLFTCDWGSFIECFLQVLAAPPGTQVAIFDVEAAHRRMPVAPEDRLHVCIRWKDQLRLDHCCCFGCSSSSGIFGRVADAIVCIYLFFLVQLILKWADDFSFWRFPTTPSITGPWEYSYDESLIWGIAAKLGWPWSLKPGKCVPFAFEFKYIGFLWNLSDKTVSLPDAKKQKFLGKLTPWVSGSLVSRKDCESLLGSLNHCSVVIMGSRSHLPSLYRFAASFGSRSVFAKRRIPSEVLRDIDWWRIQLSNPWCGMKILARPPLSPASLFVDASTSWGIGLVWNGKWLAWPLISGWKSDGRDIGWAEFVAVWLALLVVIESGSRSISLILRSDNTGVVGAFDAGLSRNAHQNNVLRRILLLSHEFDVWFNITWVPSHENLADGPSRGIFPPWSERLPLNPLIPLSLRSLVGSAVSQ